MKSFVVKDLGVAHREIRVGPHVEAPTDSGPTSRARLVVLDRAIGYGNQPAAVGLTVGRIDSSAIIIDGGIVGNRAVGYSQVPCAARFPVESTAKIVSAAVGITVASVANYQVGETGIKGCI